MIEGHMLYLFNELMSLFLFILTATAVMSDRFKDGIVVKLGLIFLSLGFLGNFMIRSTNRDTYELLVYIQGAMHMGILLCLVGYYLRFRKAKKHLPRRLSDWLSPKEGKPGPSL